VAHLVGSITGLLADPFAREVADQTRHSAEAVARAQVWAAGAVGFVRGAGERWLADRGDAVAEADRDADRETAAAQIAAWLWAGPIGVLGRERSASSTPPAPGRHRTSRVDDDAPTPGEQP
jgi:hypothetical protein